MGVNQDDEQRVWESQQEICPQVAASGINGGESPGDLLRHHTLVEGGVGFLCQGKVAKKQILCSLS